MTAFLFALSETLNYNLKMNFLKLRCYNCSQAGVIVTQRDIYDKASKILAITEADWFADTETKPNQVLAYCCIECQLKSKIRAKRHLKIVQKDSQ